ncbi:ABC transporter substrate-binding protein [Actinacidiphila yeochonensis]|uniref:ABC transporter substrate-binding protein n=1 Tax=Actinacidiphila yeochonensis TaxID=89050 RepID=UPI000AC5E5FE|nr:ABC transporter substrate-binding protein [Actinacidiphila yeochonensis]
MSTTAVPDVPETTPAPQSMAKLRAAHPMRRRPFFALSADAALAASGQARGPAGADRDARDLPSGAPAGGTGLAIAIHAVQCMLRESGLDAQLPFALSSWPGLGAGRHVIEGFRTHAVDLAGSSGIVPIQARDVGVGARIVSVRTHSRPGFVLATAPGGSIASAAGFRGGRIGIPEEEAQGVAVLRALREAGLESADVTLVPLPGDQLLGALQTGRVDVAPLGEPALTAYLARHGGDGARRVTTGVVDELSVLWAPAEVLEDDAKAEAVRAFLPLYARGVVWAWEHPEQWVRSYYAEEQGLSTADGHRIVAAGGAPAFPVAWDRAVAWQQETADLMRQSGFVGEVDAAQLFDRRFEGVTAQAVPARYRTTS